MTPILNHIDHIVYAVPDLEQACADFALKTGVQAVFGGRHLTKGTMNALVRLGDKCYLEFLAIDPDNQQVPPPRWMGVDLISEPTITRWALASNRLLDVQRLLAQYNPQMGHIDEGQRSTPKGQTLRWSLTPPQPAPLVEIVPFFIDWSAGNYHPADGLTDSGCTLMAIKLTHPQPASVATVFESLGLKTSVEKGPKAEIEIQLSSPNGVAFWS